MKAVRCRELGGPENLVLEKVPDPTLAAGQVRVKVASAGINFPDILQIAGRYQAKPQLPFTPGGEVAGTVVEVGSGVASWHVGDRVMCCLPQRGGYAEQVVVDAAGVFPVPDALDLADAGGVPVVYGTAIHALKQRGRLAGGETLLVLGASGGVGLAAVQVGKLLGAHVIAAASTEEKRQLCLGRGADETIDYATHRLKEEVKRLTHERGVDVIFDPVGDRFARDCLSSLAWQGRWLVIGFAGGGIPNIPVNLLLLKGIAAVGAFWGSFAAHEPSVNAANFQQLGTWIASGELRPFVSKHYPLSRAGQALRDMLNRKVVGKIVLTP